MTELWNPFRPFPQFMKRQVEFLRVEPDTHLDICIYQGGVGSGKTCVGAFRGLMLANKYKGSTGLVTCKSLRLLKDTTLATYLQILDAYKFKPGKDYKYLKSEDKIVFPRWGNSTILFRSLQDPNKIKSINATWAHGEEISEFTEADFFMLFSRVRDPRFPRRYLFGTTNPQATKGWIHKHFVANTEKRQTVHPREIFGDDYQGPDESQHIHYRRIIAPTTDNYALSPSHIKAMKSMYDPDYYKIFVLGEDGDYRAGLVVKNFSDLNLADTRYRSDLTIYLSCDFNVDPMCWVLFHRFNGEYHYFDEIVMENTTTLETIDEFIDRYPHHTAGLVITGDASGDARSTQANRPGATNYKTMLKRLSEVGYRNVRLDIKRANPNVRDRVMAFNAMVCNTDGVRRIFMNPDNCQHLIWNMDNLCYYPGTDRIWKPTPEEMKQDRTYKFYMHPFDAASYPVEKYNPIRIRPDERGGSHKPVTVPFKPGR